MAAVGDASAADEQVDDVGNLTVTFRGPPGADASACSGAVQWPRLDSLLLLGVGPVDVASVRLQVETDALHGLPVHGQALHCRLKASFRCQHSVVPCSVATL